jgi:hypothetical protein
VLEETERLRGVVDTLSRVHVHEREQIQAYAYRGRQLAHAIRGNLGIVVGILSLMFENPDHTPAERAHIRDAIDAMSAATSQLDDLHGIVRELAPDP